MKGFIRHCAASQVEQACEAYNRKRRCGIQAQAQRQRQQTGGFTASQRVWAACELMRSCHDVKTDHITYRDIQAYWDAQTRVDETAHDADDYVAADAAAYADDYTGSPDINLLGITFEAEVAKMLAADTAQPAAANTTDGNTPDGSGNSRPPTRVERRRQQLAARKADITDDEAAFILGDDLILEDQADIDAFKAYIHQRLIAQRDANLRRIAALNADANPDADDSAATNPDDP